MKTGPLISVIIPYYNSEEYLERCVSSVTSQSYRALEILLVDDGSQDSSPEMARSFARGDSRIRCITIDHSGVSEARNSGLVHAQGSLVMFVDSDDWLADGILGRMAGRMEETGADLVTCNLVRADSPACRPTLRAQQERIYTRDEYLRLFFRIGTNRIVHFPVGKLYRRDLLPEHLFPPGIRVGEDVVGSYLAISRADRILSLGETGYYYYNNPRSATAGFSEKDFDLIRVWDMMLELTRGKEPEASYAALNRDRLSFTLLFRMITEVPESERKKYEKQQKQLLTRLRGCEKELLHSPIVLSRKVLIVLLCHAYPAASVIGGFLVRIRHVRGKQAGFTRRKLT